MAFIDFKSIQQVQETFNIKYNEAEFIVYSDLEPSAAFMAEFTFSRQNIDIFSSEASRCENVIYPLIKDVYKNYVTLYSIWSHKALAYNKVLSGIADYIITSKSVLGKTALGKPIVVVVEAKQNNFIVGWGQCLAELLAAQKINKNEAMPVYGIVTDGEFWQFGQLQYDLFTKNETAYAISDLKKISGALGYLLNQGQGYLTK